MSCLVDNFIDIDYFYNSCMGELTICADNCVGQNKNMIVKLFIIWIIETGFFPKETLLSCA